MNFEGNDSSTIEITIIDDGLAEGREVFVGLLEVYSPFRNYSVKIDIEIIDNEGSHHFFFFFYKEHTCCSSCYDNIIMWYAERGVCVHMIGGRNCSENALCTVVIGRKLIHSCSCKDNFLGNGFICQGVWNSC